MRPRALSILAGCFALTAAGWAQSADVAKDARLQKPLSVKLKIVPIGDAIPQLTKLVGVTLDSALNVRDLKIDVFVHDVPAGQVLSKIASVLGCEWRPDGETLRLVMASEEQTARDRYIDAENKAALKEITDKLTVLTQLTSIDPTTIDQELAQQEQDREAHKSTYDPSRTELLKEAKNPQDVQLGKFLSTMSPEKVNAFWRGDPVPANMKDLEDQPRRRPGPGGPPPIPRNGAVAQLVRTNDFPMFVQFDPYLYQLKVAQGTAVRTVGGEPSKIVTQPKPTGDLAKMPFGKEVLAWDQAVPGDGDLTKVSVTSTSTESKYPSKAYGLADFLEKAYNQTGVSIVSDAFRVPAAFKDLNRGLGSFASWLSTLKSDNSLATRFEDGIVMIRHGGFWRLRKFETPEDQLATLESKSGRTLEDYALFASKLTPEQAREFELKDGVLAKFDTKPLEVGMPALLFYNSLGRNEVTRALQDGISYGQLSTSQRQSFLNATIEGIFLGAAPSAFGLGLVRVADSGDARGLGFIIRKDDTVGGANPVQGQDLLFGANLSEASIYKLPVAQ